MMPLTCDALLGIDDRYASDKFRRVARRFNPERLDFDHAMELCAFVDVVGLRWARKFFLWDGQGTRAYNRLRVHFGDDVRPYADWNRSMLDERDALAMLACMREHGFRYGKMPDFIEDAIRGRWKAGERHKDIMARYAITRAQVNRVIYGSRAPGKARRRVGLGVYIG